MDEILYQALGAEYGIIVHSPEMKRDHNKLSIARTKNPEFTRLAICYSPTSHDEIWIVKRPDPNGDSSE